MERHVTSETAADGALELALRDRAGVLSRGHVPADSRLSTLTDAWYAGLTDLSPTTMEAYRLRLDWTGAPR